MQELKTVGFPYSSDWKTKVLTDNEGKPLNLYLKKGAHKLRMEATLGEVGAIINKLQDSITLTTMPIYELDVNDVIFIDEESLNVEHRDFDKIGLNSRDDGYLENETTTYGMYVIKGIETNENQTLKLQKVCEWRFNHDDLYNLKTLGIPSEDCMTPQGVLPLD